MIELLGHSFASYAEAARRIYVSPGAGHDLSRLTPQAIRDAIHDGRLTGSSTNTNPPFTVSVEALAAWVTLRQCGASFRKPWLVQDLLRAVHIIPKVYRIYDGHRRKFIQRILVFDTERHRAVITVMPAD